MLAQNTLLPGPLPGPFTSICSTQSNTSCWAYPSTHAYPQAVPPSEVLSWRLRIVWVSAAQVTRSSGLVSDAESHVYREGRGQVCKQIGAQSHVPQQLIHPKAKRTSEIRFGSSFGIKFFHELSFLLRCPYVNICMPAPISRLYFAVSAKMPETFSRPEGERARVLFLQERVLWQP